MENLLSQWWISGTMVSEFVSSMLLAFVVYSTTFILGKRSEGNKVIKWLIAPMSNGFGGMCAIFIGMEAGNAVEGGTGLSLMSAPFTFLKAIYYNSYNLVIAAVSFQLLGALTGALLNLGLAKVVVKYRQDGRKFTDGLLFPDLESKEKIGKEAIAQTLLIMNFVFLTVVNYGFSIKGNIYFGIFVTSIIIVMLFMSTTKWFYFMLSPQLMLASLIAGQFLGLTKAKHWYQLGFNIAIQVSAVCLVAFPEYAMRTR